MSLSQVRGHIQLPRKSWGQVARNPTRKARPALLSKCSQSLCNFRGPTQLAIDRPIKLTNFERISGCKHAPKKLAGHRNRNWGAVLHDLKCDVSSAAISGIRW